MEHWLGVAASRGHEYAAMMLQKLHETRSKHGLEPKPVLRELSDPNATSLLLRLRSKRKAGYVSGIKLEHVNNFEIFTRNDLEEVRAILRIHSSNGLDMNSILHRDAQSSQRCSEVAKMSLLH